MAQKVLDNQFNYWQYIISTNHQVFETQYLKGELNDKSIVVHIEIFDEDKGIIKSGWSAHKNISSTLGFLQHVVIPSAYYTFMDRESEGFFIPLSSFNVVVEEVMKLVDANDKASSETNDYFNKVYNQLGHIYNNKDLTNKLALKRFSEGITANWKHQNKQKLSIKLFYKPSEIADYICSDDFCAFEEVTEEMLGMSVDEFKAFCNNVYTHPFINKSFIDRLNYTLPYLTL